MTTRFIRLGRPRQPELFLRAREEGGAALADGDDVFAGRDTVAGDGQARLDRVALAGFDRKERRVAVPFPAGQQSAAAVVGDAADLMPRSVRVLRVPRRRDDPARDVVDLGACFSGPD